MPSSSSIPPSSTSRGSKPRREILDRIIADIERGDLDGIAVAKLDRLSRLRPTDRVALIERIEDAGGVIRSASENVDVATPEGRFTRDLFLGIARMQWEQKAEGFEMSAENATENGIAVKSVAPYGFKFDAEHRLKVDPVPGNRRCRAIRAARRRLLIRSARRALPRPHGRTVSAPTIRYMLRNRVYVGELHYGDKVNLEPGFPAIVPLDLFETVQRSQRAARHREGCRRQPGKGAARQDRPVPRVRPRPRQHGDRPPGLLLVQVSSEERRMRGARLHPRRRARRLRH